MKSRICPKLVQRLWESFKITSTIKSSRSQDRSGFRGNTSLFKKWTKHNILSPLKIVTTSKMKRLQRMKFWSLSRLFSCRRNLVKWPQRYSPPSKTLKRKKRPLGQRHLWIRLMKLGRRLTNNIRVMKDWIGHRYSAGVTMKTRQIQKSSKWLRKSSIGKTKILRWTKSSK